MKKKVYITILRTRYYSPLFFFSSLYIHTPKDLFSALRYFSTMSELLDPPNKTFADLMMTQEIPVPNTQQEFKDTCRYFQSVVRPFRPIVAPGVFGGHVLAQCAIVGARTVDSGYIMHNIHGYFILPGKQDVPFTYKVETLRNGKSYSVRQIRVYQPSPKKGPIADFDFGSKDLCFIGICSYKQPEETILEHQRELAPEFRLENRPENVHKIPLAPDIDVPSWEDYTKDPDNSFVQEVHPIEMRKLNTNEENKDRECVTERRQIHYLKSHDVLPDDFNLHIAALLYASDRNSLFTILNLQDGTYHPSRIASIDHAFIMHNLDTRVDQGWLTMETFTDRSVDGRGLYNGRIFDKDHRLVCSFMQDGVLRVFRPEAEDHEPASKL